jgi:hypothetical protein
VLIATFVVSLNLPPDPNAVATEPQ